MMERTVQGRFVMVSSAQLQAARAYLGWTMDTAAAAAGLHRRTLIRLENDVDYAWRQPDSLRRLVAVFRAHCILLEGEGLLIADAPAGEKHVDGFGMA